LRSVEQLVNFGKRRVGMIVVIHQPMFAHAIAANIVERFAHRLQRGLTIMNAAGDFFGRLHQRAEEAPLLRVRRTVAIVGLVPHLHVGEQFFRTQNNFSIIVRRRQLFADIDVERERVAIDLRTASTKPTERCLRDARIRGVDDFESQRVFHLSALHFTEPRVAFFTLAQTGIDATRRRIATEFRFDTAEIHREFVDLARHVARAFKFGVYFLQRAGERVRHRIRLRMGSARRREREDARKQCDARRAT
jgi:hypothetical protein